MHKILLTVIATLTLSLAVPAYADYLSPDLRSRVNQLMQSIDSIPTNDTNAESRARLTWEWINAYALNGNYVPVNATQVVAGVLGGAASGAYGPLDATIRELAFLDANPEALGTLTATLGPFTAGEYATVRQTYTVGSQPVQTGGAFLLARHFMTNFGPWQNSDPKAPNYVAISTSNPKVSFVATTTPWRGMHGGFRDIRETMTFRVASGTLDAGDTVTISWGETAGGSPGMRMATMSSDRLPLPLYVSLNNKGQFLSLPIQPIRVTGAGVAGVAGFAPSIVSPGEKFTLSVRARDQYFNRAHGTVPDWVIHFDDKNSQPLPATGAITLTETSLLEPGIYRPTINSADGQLTGTVNPILVTAEPRDRIYWGDTHGHSGFAEGIGTAERFMQWAREDARLDYVTHSEHDIWLDDHEWEVLREIVQRYTVEGEFVAYLGYEWTVNNLNGGHHNVLFRTPADRQRVPAQFFPTLAQLYNGLRNAASTNDVVVIPHAHQAGDYRMSDPALEPLIEIMSQHGNFEWFGRQYLRHGHQVGFTAASDNHLSQPGYSAPQGGSLSQRGGLGAILAPSRTVDGIFDGMRALKSYATTGDRIIIDFDVNGVGMGGRTPFSETRAITANIHGTAPIDTVTLMKNDQVLWEKSYYDSEATRASKQETLLLSFASDSEPVHPGDNPRGWRAWEGTLQLHDATLVDIQPVDAGFPGQSLDLSERQDGRIRFATKTRGDSSSYLIRLKDVARGARLHFDLIEGGETGGAPPVYRPPQRNPAISFSLSIRDMQDNRLTHTQQIDAYTDRVTLRRVIEQGQLDVNLTVNDQSLRQGDYYYLRVVQANDAIGWSSPVWVGGHPTR